MGKEDIDPQRPLNALIIQLIPTAAVVTLPKDEKKKKKIEKEFLKY